MSGGKGRRRREKNWLAAHGGGTRLPPPPKPKELEALPSKLRRIIELKNPHSSNPGRQRSLRGDSKREKKKGSGVSEGKDSNDVHSSTNITLRIGDSNELTTSNEHKTAKDLDTNRSSDVVRTRKRKRKGVQDLRFQNLEDDAVHLSKKARKKEYLKAKKKKRKAKKMDNVLNFPGREEIKFGEVVEAPPKLSFPKAQKTTLNASAERKRLQAVEAYRSHRRWVDRPGLKLPTLSEALSP